MEEKEKQGNGKSNQPDHNMQDQGGQSSPDEEEMPDATGGGITEEADGAAAERGDKRMKLKDKRSREASQKEIVEMEKRGGRDRDDSHVPQVEC